MANCIYKYKNKEYTKEEFYSLVSSSNFIQQEQAKKFQELQERLNNKEFLEGAKNAFESSEELQQFGTQEQYNDYIARVSLGIIRNPSSGEYNYNSQVKDVVYRGGEKEDTKLFQYWTNNKAEAYMYAKANITKGGNITERNPIPSIYKVIKESFDKKYGSKVIDSILLDEDNYLDFDEDGEPYTKFPEWYDKNALNKLSNEDKILVRNFQRLQELYSYTKIESESDLMKQYDDTRYIDNIDEHKKLRAWFDENLDKKAIRENIGKISTAVINIKNPYTEEIIQEDLQNDRDAYKNGHDGAFLMDGDHFLVKSNTEQIHILGSKQDIEGFKQFVKSPIIIKEVETAESIYSKLGNKTQSENVVIKPWSELKNAKEAVVKNDKINYSEYTNYSGAAQGGDTVWENVGKEFGLGKQVNYRPEDLQKLTKEQLQEVENAYQQAVKDLGRKPLASNTFAGGLVRRDYLQAKAADAVFAISTIVQPNEKDPKGYTNKTSKPLVAGGTGYAVQMAINLGKPVYVFDQIKNKWFVWSSNNFVETNTPTLTKKFAGIGTREINENGKQAIRDVYNNNQQPQIIIAYRGNRQKTFVENFKSNGVAKRPVTIGNPFDWQTETGSRKEQGIKSTKKFIDWLITGNNYGEANATEQYRNLIIDNIKNGELKGRPIGYYEEKGYATHATALDYLINKYDWNNDNIKYQLEANRDLPLESTDPSFKDYVQKRLKALFPFVQSFSSKEAFESAASKIRAQPFSLHYIGSAIKNLVFVDPEKATQDTRIHEYAHIYWDALPNNEPVKRKLIAKFGNEELAIEAIGQAGVRLLNAEFNQAHNQGNAFVNMLKEFWKAVKKAFGINSKENLAEAFAERLLTNADDITYESVANNINQYYQKKDFEPSAESIIAKEGIVKELKLKDISELSFSDVLAYTRPDDEENLRDLGVGESLYEKTYFRLHNEKAPKEFKIIAGNIKENEKSFAPISIEQFYKQVFKTDTSFSELKPNTANYKKVNEMYVGYVEEFQSVQKRIWNKIKNEDVLQTLRLNDNDKTGNKSIDSLQSMWDFLTTLNSIAANDAKSIISDIFVKKAMHSMILEENSKGLKNMPATKFFYDMVNGKITTDWSGASFISGRLSMISPSNTTDTLIQLRETIMRDALRTAEAEQDIMRQKLGDTINKINKLKGDWKLIYADAADMAKQYNIDSSKVPNAYLYIPAYTESVKQHHQQWAKVSPLSFARSKPSIDKKYKAYFDLKNSTNPAKKALAEYLDIINELENQHLGYAEHKPTGFLRVAQIPADVSELIKKHGWKEGIKRYMNQETILDEVVIQTDDINPNKYFMTLKEAKDFVYKKYGSSLLTYPIALKKMSDLNLKAEKQFQSGKMANGEFIPPEQIKKIKLEIGFNKKQDATENIGEATRKYYDNLIRQNALEKIIPISSYAQNYFSRNNKTNIARWLTMMDNDTIYNEKPEILPKPYSNFIQSFVNYTHWINLALNLTSAPFNALQGLTGTSRDIGFRATMKGSWRMAKSPTSAYNLLKRLQIVNTSQDAEISVHGTIWKKFSNLMFSPITAVEYINHGYSFIGSMTDAEWSRVLALPKTATSFDFYDAMGKGDRLEGLRRVEELHQATQNINGSYAPFAKRGINKTSVGRAIMQFKNWLPDLVREHYTFNTGTQELEKETMHGSQVKGIFNTVFDKPMYKEFKKNMSNESFAIAWQKLKPIDRHNLKRFMREMFMIGGIATVWASLDEDDKEIKKAMVRALQDLTYAFNPETGQYLLSSPVPIMKTVQNLLKLIEELGKTAIGNPTTYVRDTNTHEAGDWRAPVMLVEVMPAKRLVKNIFFTENEITE